MTNLDRAMAYLEKLPDAISGSGGHDATLRAACECVRFGLTDSELLEALCWYNVNKCHPQWTEKELAHKIETAKAKARYGERVPVGRSGKRSFTPPNRITQFASKAVSAPRGNAGNGQKNGADQIPTPAPSAGKAQPKAAPPHAPEPAARAGNSAQPVAQRVGLRVLWGAGVSAPTIGDYWQRLADGRILATYTPEELAAALATLGRNIPADVIRAECGAKLRPLPVTGAGDLPAAQPEPEPKPDPAGDYWQFVLGQEAEALALGEVA